MNDGPWAGLSLRFIRTVLGQAASFPYPDANRAREASGPLRDGVPPTGAVCWYASKHGNVALSLGVNQDDYVLVACIIDGWPDMANHTHPLLGGYLGWTPTIGPASQFREIFSGVPESESSDG